MKHCSECGHKLEQKESSEDEGSERSEAIAGLLRMLNKPDEDKMKPKGE